MFAFCSLREIGDTILVVFFAFILLSSIVLTIKTRFIQVRMIPKMFKLLFGGIFGKRKQIGEDVEAIPPYQALFTAMSTTIGIGNIAGPAVAIRLGGPGALLCLLVVLFLGSATTFTEVTLALNYRKKLSDGSYAGGAMQYIKEGIGSLYANIYAYTGAALLVVWSSNQSNTLSDIVAVYNIPRAVTGFAITAVVMFYLISGIKKIGALAAKIVPFMFILYSGACLWVIMMNIGQLPAVFKLMFQSFFTPQAMTGAAAGITVQKMLRWGLAKGTHIGEGGIGTATIPHSQSTTKKPIEQGIISMVSTYSVATLCLLSGLVILLTGVWQDNSVSLGINMISVSFAQYIPGSYLILASSAFLFALGTILGNAYNGSQCFLYATKNRWVYWYYAIVGIIVFVGSIVDAEFVWGITDYFIVPVALPNIIAVLILAFKRSNLLEIKS